MFNRETFVASFKKSLKSLTASEKTTRAELQVLSRTVLEASIETGDVAYINAIIAVLTPVNKKVAVKFFTEFSGFAFDDTIATGKSKKNWDKHVVLAKEFLADPMNNIWSWADRNIEIVSKEFTLEQVTDAFKKFVKKAEKAGLTQKDVLKAAMQAGVELDTVVSLMGEMYDVDVAQS